MKKTWNNYWRICLFMQFSKYRKKTKCTLLRWTQRCSPGERGKSLLSWWKWIWALQIIRQFHVTILKCFIKKMMFFFHLPPPPTYTKQKRCVLDHSDCYDCNRSTLTRGPEKFISHSSRVWKVRDAGIHRYGVWWRTTSGFTDSNLVTAYLRVRKRGRALMGLFHKGVNSVPEGATLMT